MATPNNGIITETNAQYYAGSQTFEPSTSLTLPATFNTDLIFGSFNPITAEYNNNNFRLYVSASGVPNTFVEYI